MNILRQLTKRRNSEVFEKLQKLANQLKKRFAGKIGKIIVFINQKGGIGKTTLSHAFAYLLAKLGFAVLIIDIDPSGNISSNSEADRTDTPGVMELLLTTSKIDETIQYIEKYGYYVIAAPEGRQLESKDFIKMLDQTETPAMNLRNGTETLRDHFDFIIIDTGPNLNDATMNGLVAADEIIVPTTININSLDGIADLWDAVCSVRESGVNALPIRGILINRFNARGIADRETKDFIDQIAAALNAPVFSTYIRHAAIVERATKARQALTAFKEADNTPIIDDIYKFMEEYLKGENESVANKATTV